MEDFLQKLFTTPQRDSFVHRVLPVFIVVVTFFPLCLHAQLADAREQAITAERAGRNDEAETAWLSVAKQNPASAEPYAHLGLLEARQQHLQAAIEYYLKARKLSPKMPGLSLNLGLAYFKNGDYKEAIAEFEPLLKAQLAGGGNADELQRLNVLLGMSHYGLGQFKEAAPLLKQASERDPANLPLLLSLAHSCLLSHDFPCVQAAYHQIIGLNAESAEADMLAGEALDEMGDTVSAVREFRAAIAVNTQEPLVHFGLGYLLWKQKDYAGAVDEFKAEIARQSGDAQSLLYLGDSYVQLNRYAEAQPVLMQVAVELPKNAMVHVDLGILYTETDRKADAVRELEQAERLDTKDVNVHWRLGKLYRAMGKTAEAKTEFEKASEINKSQDAPLLNVLPSTQLPASVPQEHKQ